MIEIRNYGLAAISVAETLVKPPSLCNFRKLCLASLDYVHRLQTGHGLSTEKRIIVNGFLSLGMAINDYYDINSFDQRYYRNLRNDLKLLSPSREKDYCQYRQEVSALEKNRPSPMELIARGEQRLLSIQEYREQVNHLSLAFSFSVAFDRPFANYWDKIHELPREERINFIGFYNAVMALQVIDDLVGRQGDISSNRPSFYTAVCLPEELSARKIVPGNPEAVNSLDKIFNQYLAETEACAHRELSPILTAVKMIKIVYPGLTDIVRKRGMKGKFANVRFVTFRDLENL
jgi:hypothetical protein